MVKSYSQLNFRVPAEIAEKFVNLCKAAGETQPGMFTEMLKVYFASQTFAQKTMEISNLHQKLHDQGI